jgi:EAL domain-containing protein (putative c-di-GMP-specific phosphodiesterase class I)
MELAAELDQALSNGDIWVAYQPKLDIAHGVVTSSEALVRWRHPKRGPIPPDSFIPGLEAMGRMSDLTLFVLRQAMEDQSAWRAQGRCISVSVNVSAQLPKDPDFVAAVETLVSQYRPPEGMITLEVTESAAMQDSEAAIAALTRFTEMGLVISVDDYGAGQSTLGYLKALPAKELKIDQGFVVGMAASRSDQAMVRSTIDLAHELGYKVVAEGVETPEILELRDQLGLWFEGDHMTVSTDATAHPV